MWPVPSLMLFKSAGIGSLRISSHSASWGILGVVVSVHLDWSRPVIMLRNTSLEQTTFIVWWELEMASVIKRSRKNLSLSNGQVTSAKVTVRKSASKQEWNLRKHLRCHFL